MPTRLLLLLSLALALAAVPAPAGAADYVPGEVIVRYADGGAATRLDVEHGKTVGEAVAELRSDPKVDYAVPNYVARASQFTPNDPRLRRQWNLIGTFGIHMREAWALAEAAGAPGGRGVTVAVLDTGVAFETRGPFRRAPDLRRSTFVDPWDFVDHDPHPNDRSGHGTHVTGTIAQATNNGVAVAGIAYNVKIMPLKVLNQYERGDSFAIARAIRYASRHGADVINLSLEFDRRFTAYDIPEILSAIRFAHKRGVVLVAAAGNSGKKFLRSVAYPARARGVIAVGASTRDGCRSDYSSFGADLDVVAPGGGIDAEPATAEEEARCHPEGQGDFIYQQTFTGASVRRFGLPPAFEGTSFASPHVAAVAALVIAAHKLGANPSPAQVQAHLQATARDLGKPGPDRRYGYGLIDAAAALRCPAFTPC